MQYASDQPKNVYMYMQLHGFFFLVKNQMWVSNLCLKKNVWRTITETRFV